MNEEKKEHFVDDTVHVTINFTADVSIDEDEVVEVWQNNRHSGGMSLMEYIAEAEEQLRDIGEDREEFTFSVVADLKHLPALSLEEMLGLDLDAEYPHLKFENVRITAYHIDTYKEIKQ